MPDLIAAVCVFFGRVFVGGLVGYYVCLRVAFCVFALVVFGGYCFLEGCLILEGAFLRPWVVAGPLNRLLTHRRVGRGAVLRCAPGQSPAGTYRVVQVKSFGAA